MSRSEKIFIMPNDNSKKFSEVNSTSDSDSDPVEIDWNKELINAICQPAAGSESDPEQYRLYRVKTCLSEKADINIKHGKNHDTILHTAVKKNYRRIVEFLVERGAQTDITNRKGYTATALAEALDNQTIVNILKGPNNQRFNRVSEGRSVDDQQPSTSREAPLPSRNVQLMKVVDDQGLNSGLVIRESKRKPTTDSEDHESIKKQRSELHNVHNILGNQAITNILDGPNNRRFNPASTHRSVDDQQPSTSRGASSPHRNLSSRKDVDDQGHKSGLVALGPKRKPTTDSKDHESIKKRQLGPHNIQSRQLQPASNLDFVSTSIVANSSPDSDDEGTIQAQTSRFDRELTYPAGGLKSSFHGVVYQLKHLGFTLLRAMQPKQEISFLLSTERVDVGKFDDLVLEYRNRQGNDVDLFLQLKHSRTANRLVNAYDLLEKEDGDFFVPKYFSSWCEIKRSPLFSDNVSRNVVLGTNIGLNLEGLGNAEISYEEVPKPVECLEMIGTKEETICYKFTANVGSNRRLYHKLKKTSDVYILARELVEHVLQRKKMTLVGIFKQYHIALGEHVIDTKKGKFFKNFIKNKDLPPKTREFRKIFFVEFSKLKNKSSKREVPENVICNVVEESTLELSKNFGEKFKLPAGPPLTDISVFSQEFLKLLKNATSDNVVKISKNIYRKNARRGSVERVVADNIDKLAGHVLITKCGKIKFRSQFFDDCVQSSGNIEKFRKYLKSELGSKFNELDRFEIEINSFETCEEEELYPNTELPDGDMAETDITEFLNVFILAVNLPNEVELGEMITRELGDESNFNLLDSDLMGRTFLTKIVDWFKEMGKKVGEGRYLSYKGGEVFFNEMENQINTLKSVGVTSVYWEELKEYDIDFERENTRLRAFLSENESNSAPHRILILVAPREPLLTALRVCQTLRTKKSIRKDSFIFIRLRTLSLRGIKDQIISAFQSQRSHHLLVIECDSASMKRNVRRLWLSLCKAIENVESAGKSIILIVQGDTDSAILLAEEFEGVFITHIEEDDDINFGNLTESSRQKLLEKPIVNFQGYGNQASFGTLLGLERLDNIGVDESKDIREVMDANTLVALIRGDDAIQIGNDLEELGEIEHYYINRTIVQHIVIKEDILKDREMPDLLAISGIDKELQEEPGREEETIPTVRNLRNLTVLNSGQEVEQFRILCDKNTQRNIHWLKEESDKYIWMQSVGDITNLLQYRDASEIDDNNKKTGATYLSDDHFAACDGPVIVSDAAGMGKSTMLTYLAKIIKKNESDLLVLKIDLNRHTTALAEVKKNLNYNLGIVSNAIEFLVDHLLNLQTNLEKKVFKAIIEKQRKVALIFDGFDEISPTYENIVSDFLQALAKHRVRKLFVATRPHTRGALENRLNTFCYELEPFSTLNQEEFLFRFWTNGLDMECFNQETESCVRSNVKGIIRRLSYSINDRTNKFTGIPIQTKLVAEICQNLAVIHQNLNEKRRGNINSYEEIDDSTNNQPTLPKKIDLLYLYEHFVDMKFDIFFKKRGGNLADPAVLEGRQLRYDMFIDTHEKLALDLLFDEDKVKKLLPSRRDVKRESNIVQERTGIITQFINGKPLFGHRTYAEYFGAKFLSEKLKEGDHSESVRKIFVTDIFLGEDFKILRAFMNCLLSDEHNNSFEGESWKFYLTEHRNSMNRTIFHVAAAEGNELFLKLFLNCLSEDPEKRKALIDFEDGHGKTAVYWAARYGYSKELKLLVENGDGKVDSCSEVDGETPLYAAASAGKLDVVKYLLDKQANVNSHTTNGQTPLHAASFSGQSDVVRYLLDNTANVEARTNDGKTPLFLATFNGNLEVIEYLLDKKANINSPTDNGLRPLHIACEVNVVKCLITKKAEIDVQTDDGRTPCYVAAKAGKLDILKYLLNHKANLYNKTKNGETVLHVAAASGKLDIVKYLLEKDMDIEIQTNNGRTPLHVAAVAGKLDVVKHLVNNKANIHSETNDGWTPLYAAAVVGEFDVIEYFIQKKANINSQAKNGWTPLHAAALVGKVRIVTYLLEKDTDVNCRTHTGDTPLHAAAFVGALDVVKSLLDKGAEVDSRTNDGKTPLYGAAFAGHLDVVKFLIENKAYVDSHINDGATPLHSAAFAGKLDVLNYLIAEGADINSQTNDGLTPLHSAAHAGNLELVKYLLDKNADINSKTKDGHTPLYAATAAGKLEMVKYLLDKEADVNSQANDGRTPLYAASASGQLDMVKCLLDEGADVNLQTNDHITALHVAAFNGRLDITKYLLDKKANVDSQTIDGKTALHIAAFNGELDTVKHLLDKGASVNAKTISGDTPLHAAVVAGRLNVVECLLDNNAEINAQANDGQKPLDLATSAGKLDLVQYLIDRHADVESQTNH